MPMVVSTNGSLGTSETSLALEGIGKLGIVRSGHHIRDKRVDFDSLRQDPNFTRI